ncbi:MAG: hypothetical protein ACRD3B_02400 [Candidatus Sulfotelmatobacter sp.]
MQKCLYAVILALLLAGAAFAQDEDIDAAAVHPSRALGTVTEKSIACKGGGVTGATCQQLTVTCPSVGNVMAYLKINTPSSPKGTVLYGTGTDGNGLYDAIFTYGKTAVQNVLNAGFRTVQVSWGTPFNTAQPGGWVQGPGGVLAASCRWATVANYVYKTVQNKTTIPMCATANSGGAGALAYVLSDYPNNISMAEVTSGPPTGRLDWGCMCKAGKMNTFCGKGSMGTCFGSVDGGVWDPAYTPNKYCSNATKGNPPPGGSAFFLADSAEASGATYKFSKTYVNVVFGGTDVSAAIPIGLDWYNKITSKKEQTCVADAPHSIPNVLDGATTIANDLIGLCKIQ